MKEVWLIHRFSGFYKSDGGQHGEHEAAGCMGNLKAGLGTSSRASTIYKSSAVFPGLTREYSGR